MPSDHSLQSILDSRGVNWVQLGALIGLTPEEFADVATHEGQLWNVSLGTFLRLAVALDTSPAAFLPETAYLDGDHYKARAPHDVGFGLAYDLAQMIPDQAAIADALGCSEAILGWWLENDAYLTEMPLSILNKLCRHLDISLLEVLGTFWHGIGRSID